MQVKEFAFKKILISKNKFYNFKNIICYEVTNEEEKIAKIEINSTFTAKIDFDSNVYYIRALTKFFVVSKLEIFSSENIKIGEIDYWSWNWKKPKISIYDKIWEFNKNLSIFKNRKNNYFTFISRNTEIISYKIELGKFFEVEKKNNCLRELNGTIEFDGNLSLIVIIGIYLNELLIFQELIEKM